MKKYLIVLYLLTNFTLHWAQSNSTLQNEITINLTNGLSIRAVSGNLDFGKVISSRFSQTLNKLPQYGVLFEVNGFSRDRININYSNNIVLSNENFITQNGGTLGNLMFIPIVQHTFGFDSYTSPRNVRNGRKVRLSREGKLYLWVGGEISISENQPTGRYEGTFNLTVAY